jgi:hypothetical protein
VRVTPPAATLRSPDDVEQYVNRFHSILADALRTSDALII